MSKQILIIVFSLTGLLGMFAYAQYRHIQSQKTAIVAKDKEIATKEENINQLEDDLRLSQEMAEKATADGFELFQKYVVIEAQHASQKQMIQRLQHENTQIKNWMDTALPSELVRVLNSPESPNSDS